MKIVQRILSTDYDEINDSIKNNTSSGVAISTIYRPGRLYFPGNNEEEMFLSQRISSSIDVCRKMFHLEVRELSNNKCPYYVEYAKRVIFDETEILLDKFPEASLYIDNPEILAWITFELKYRRNRIIEIASNIDDCLNGVESSFVYFDSNNVDNIIELKKKILLDADNLKRGLFEPSINRIIDKLEGVSDLTVISSNPNPIKKYARRKRYFCDHGFWQENYLLK